MLLLGNIPQAIWIGPFVFFTNGKSPRAKKNRPLEPIYSVCRKQLGKAGTNLLQMNLFLETG